MLHVLYDVSVVIYSPSFSL